MPLTTMITTVTALLLLFTLVFQMFSLLTIESMGNRKGLTVLEQIRFVCSTWPGGSMTYFSCSLAYIFNFGQVRFHPNPNEVTMPLPSDAVRETLRQLDDDINTPAYCLFYTTWLLVVFSMFCALSEFVVKRNRNIINLFTGILLMIAVLTTFSLIVLFTLTYSKRSHYMTSPLPFQAAYWAMYASFATTFFAAILALFNQKWIDRFSYCFHV